MGHEDDGAPLGGHALQADEELLSFNVGEEARGLVEEKYVGTDEQALEYLDPLPLSDR